MRHSNPREKARWRGFAAFAVAGLGAWPALAAASTGPCGVRFDQQVSCDGGGTWADVGGTGGDDPSSTMANGCPSAPDSIPVWRLVVSNNGSLPVTCSESWGFGPLGSIVIPEIGPYQVALDPGQSSLAVSSDTLCSSIDSVGSFAHGGTECTCSDGNSTYSDQSVDDAHVSCPSSTSSSSCTVGSITSEFNGTKIPGGYTVWFNANFSVSGITSKTTITLSGSTISFNGGTLFVPDATVTFDPAASCASTTYDMSSGRWVTTLPLAGSDEVFLTGLPYQVPAAGLPGGIKNVTWQGNFGADSSGAKISWKWGAAVYKSFRQLPDVNDLGVKAAHTNTCGFGNSDHAGTPETYKSSVTGGARGGGGSNWTGSWSATASGMCSGSSSGGGGGGGGGPG